jgi:glycosyltransferase involved in cell wall biosynthesis
LLHATTIAEADELTRWLPDVRVRVVPLGTNLPTDGSNRAAQALLARFPGLYGKRIVLYLSRIAPKKRVELLVEAVAVLRSECPDLVLLVAGHDAGQLPLVEATVRRLGLQDRVVFAGFLQGVLKQGAFQVSQLFALPSVDENFGVAVIEAMAHGVPALVTPGVATHTYVDQSDAGLTVEGNVESIADGIRRLLNGDGEAMGRRGRQFVEQNLAWPVIAKQLDQLYREVIRSHVKR